MALLTIDTDPEDSSYTQRVELDGRDYILTIQWNQREAKFYYWLADQDGLPIISGQKLTTDVDLLERVTDARKPPGQLMVIDTSGGGVDPGLHDLGARSLLVYAEATTLASGTP